MPYIQHLPKMDGVEDVLVIVPDVSLDERCALGWEVKKWLQTEDIQFSVAPKTEDIQKLLQQYEGNNTWCLFSGINAFLEVAKWFRMSLKYDVRRGVITEPPFVYDHPLWQHAIRFAMKDWRYVKFIDKIFVMGEDYLNYYRFWSKRWEVIPFMYCTEGNGNDNGNGNEDGNDNEDQNQERLRVVYVGSLSHRKNVGCLLKAAMLLSKEEQNKMEIGIVGDGDEREALKRLAEGLAINVRFYGTQPMETIPDIMEQYDVLVLPSLHDGWGAVVNEALMLGLYVICSNHCGAKMLLKEKNNGSVFKSDDSKDLASKLNYCIHELKNTRKGLKGRIEWSREQITGKAVAKYFVEKLQRQR